MEHAHDYIFKILLIGDSGVGKTSILLRYSDNVYTSTFISTIGVDFKIRTVEIDGKVIKLQLWDTAGQERFKSITSSYYRGVNGIIIIYDITDRVSFESVIKWMTEINRHALEGIDKMLIGNKCDLVDSRAVEYERAQKFAANAEMKFLETSAKDSLNIDDVFMTMIKVILKRTVNNLVCNKRGIVLKHAPIVEETSESGCC